MPVRRLHGAAGTQLLNDAAAVIISSLELLTYMEKEPSSNGYTSQIHPGAKLYHLSNSCLFPEEVLRHEKFEQLFCCLFQDISSIKDHQSIPKAFVAACYQHSRTTRSKSESNGQAKNDEADEEKLLALFEDKPSAEAKARRTLFNALQLDPWSAEFLLN